MKEKDQKSSSSNNIAVLLVMLLILSYPIYMFATTTYDVIMIWLDVPEVRSAVATVLAIIIAALIFIVFYLWILKMIHEQEVEELHNKSIELQDRLHNQEKTIDSYQRTFRRLSYENKKMSREHDMWLEEGNHITKIEALNLNTRTYNALKRSEIYTVEKLMKYTYEELSNIRNLGKTGLNDIKEKLQLYLDSSNK